MPLSIRDKLGHYDVLALLGKGGMGEVYRARDTQLKRDVALKVLPAAFANNPERLARFQREAEVLASLDHPNIGHIHGIVQSRDNWALVLALIEGPTLADRIAQGAMPADEAITAAKQIIDAMEYAHDHNVIHRDLKPANIKITPDGVVKVLDFGLAKALDDQRPASLDPENSPTLTMGATQAGVIMGTAAYMSPEQAVGKPADRRADIFSFGVLLYEMLTGKRAFKGDTVGDTLAAVVKEAPDWSALPAETPSYLRKLLERMLAKDRRQRLQAIGEARLALEVGEPEVSEAVRPAQARSLPYMLAVGAMAVIAAGLAFLHFGETPPEQTLSVSTVLPPAGYEINHGGRRAIPSISPDGKQIVFGARGEDGVTRLFIRQLNSLEARALPGTEESGFVFWSPDSKSIAFGTADNKLRRMETGGGQPITITQMNAPLRGGTWNRDGVIIFSTNGLDPLYRVAAGGGKASSITRVGSADINGNVAPQFLPDQKHFLYAAAQSQTELEFRVASLDNPGAGKPVLRASSSAIFAGGYLLFLRESTLMAQAFDVESLATTGDAMPVAENVATVGNPNRAGLFSASSNGILVYRATGVTTGRPLEWVDRNGKVLGTLASATDSYGDLELSPDGRSLLAAVSGGEVLWNFDVQRGVRTRFPAPGVYSSVWTPNGRSVIASNDGEKALYRYDANGTSAGELLFKAQDRPGALGISPDGSALFFTLSSDKSGDDLWLLPLGPGERKARPFLQTPFAESGGRFSPDGKWVAYMSNETGSNQIYVVPYPGPGPKIAISSGSANVKPRWRADGKEIFYHDREGTLIATEVSVRNGVLEVGKSQTLVEGIDPARGYQYDVTADGQKFLVSRSGGSGGGTPLTLIHNWTELLKR